METNDNDKPLATAITAVFQPRLQSVIEMIQVISIAEIPDLFDQDGRLTGARSSAKRMRASFDSNSVVLDFALITEVSPVSRSFFDELFRVSRLKNPALTLVIRNAPLNVQKYWAKAERELQQYHDSV